MSHKYFDGKVLRGEKDDKYDKELQNLATSAIKQVEEKLEIYKVSDAIKIVINLAKACNKYIDLTTPWVLAKDENGKERLKEVLYNLLESIRMIGILISPFMPQTSAKIFEQLNCDDKSYETLLSFGHLKEDTVLGKPSPLFARIDKEKLLKELQNE